MHALKSIAVYLTADEFTACMINHIKYIKWLLYLFIHILSWAYLGNSLIFGVRRVTGVIPFDISSLPYMMYSRLGHGTSLYDVSVI